MEYFKNGLFKVTDRLGDGVLYVFDEVKFWGEVVSEFFEFDSTSSDRHLMEVR